MKKFLPATHGNFDLEVVHDNKGNWNLPHNRRYSFQNFSKIHRYGLTFRSPRVLRLSESEDKRIERIGLVEELVAHPYFCAISVVRDGKIIFERLARDFSHSQAHSIQSISKTMTNLLVGGLVESGRLKLHDLVTDIVPEVKRGFSGATVQMLLNMDVMNDYSEDFTNPDAMYYEHEESMGWRLPDDPGDEDLQRPFLERVSCDRPESSPFVKYKDCNTEVLGWIIERVGGISLPECLARIIDGAGIERQFSMSCDRNGVPVMDGGGCMTIRDLVRYGSIFARDGLGVNGERFFTKEWITQTLRGGILWNYPKNDGTDCYYSNHMDTDRRGVGHGGYCGQYLYVDTVSKIVVGFFSVTDEKDGLCDEHFEKIWKMMQAITRIDG